MRKRSYLIVLIMAIFIVLSFCLVACNTDKNYIKIDYVIDGKVYQSCEYEKNDISLISPEKVGMLFDGWYLDELLSQKITEKDINDKTSIKLYGQFVYNKFFLEYIVDEEIISSVMLDDLQNIEFIQSPVKEGYSFAGWYIEDTLIDKNNIANYCSTYGVYQLVAKYDCMHTNLGQEYVKNQTCEKDGKRFAECLNCTQTIYIGIAEALGHDFATEFVCDDNRHWHECSRCDIRQDEQEHTLTDVDSCTVCLYYLQDEAMPGSKVTTLGRRQAIDNTFKNIPNLHNGTLEMVTINIGQGDCIFIKFPDGKTMVMDAGHVMTQLFENNYDRLKEVLDLYGVKQLDYLFLTHSDYDHVKCVEKLLKNYEVKNIYIPKATDKHNSNTYEDVVKAIANESYTENGVKKSAVVRYHIGDYQIAGDGWRMKCHTYLAKDYPTVTDKEISSSIAVKADKDEIINSLSPICLLEYAGRTIVLTGDSNKYNEKYLLERGVFADVDADILKVAHHGSATSTTAEFLSAVKCEYAIISHGGLFGHPTSDVLDRLNASDCKNIFETKRDGNVTVSIFGNGNIDINTQSSENIDLNNNFISYVCNLKSNIVATIKQK